LKKLWLLLPVIAAAAIVWGIIRKSDPPEIRFARVKRQTLVSVLPTNGKVEPFEWQAVRAEISGVVSRVPVRDGQNVAQGAELAAVTSPDLQADIDAAQAKLSEARANLDALQMGGKPAELVEIENSLSRAQLQLQQETSERDSLQRLAAKQAATPVEVRSAEDKVAQTNAVIEGLARRRSSLVGKTDVAAAQARLEDAEVALKLARDRAAQSIVRSPLAGAVYGLAVRTGAFLNIGDLVANVGQLDRLRVRVYVDEPELGRVATGQPVSISWQALPGRKWQGAVERKPTSIQALGSRQVGEVVCTISNPGRELIPGTNVDAEIRTAVVDNALVIPREALRHDAAGDYVFALVGETVERRAVKTGASSVTLVQVAEGLSENDAVALPSETPLKPGARVKPAF
jgi:HlyD family secretion protein